MMIKKAGLTIALLGTLSYGDPACEFSRFFISDSFAAGNDNQNLNINASIVGKCIFANGGSDISIAMDPYDSVGTQSIQPDNTSGSLDVTCSKNATVDFKINNGSNASGSTRRMLGDGGDYLVYDLYKDAAMTQRWGETAADDYQLSSTSGGPESITIYAKIPAGQDPSVGNYNDTLTLTVSY